MIIQIKDVYFIGKPEKEITIYNDKNLVMKQFCNKISFDMIGCEIKSVDMFVLDGEYDKFIGSIYAYLDEDEINFVWKC